jgi:hypothetical protein
VPDELLLSPVEGDCSEARQGETRTNDSLINVPQRECVSTLLCSRLDKKMDTGWEGNVLSVIRYLRLDQIADGHST